MVLLGDEAHLEARFGPFGDSANLDARSVHGLHRTYHRLGNHFGCPDDTPRDEGQVKAHFSPFRDSVNLSARYDAHTPMQRV